MEYQYKLRPHHGLCISFFSAKRDSEKYKEHMDINNSGIGKYFNCLYHLAVGHFL